MKKIKPQLWAIKTAFGLCRWLYVILFIAQIIRATLVAYTAAFLGYIINDIAAALGNGGIDINYIVKKLIIYGILNVILWLAVELRWRISDDLIPVRSKVKSDMIIMNITRHIPLRYFDKSEFNEEYALFADGISSLPSFFKRIISLIIQLYTIVLSFYMLWKINYIFVVIITVFFVIVYFYNKASVDMRSELRQKTIPLSRKADYLSGMFMGIYNRETRLYGRKDEYIKKWLDLKTQIVELEADVNKKSDRRFGLSGLFGESLISIIVIVVSLIMAFLNLITIGSIYTVREMSKNIIGGLGDIIGNVIGIFVTIRKIDETWNFYDNIMKYTVVTNEKNLSPDINKPAIEIKNMSFSYLDNTDVVKNIDLTLPKGKTVAIVGANGSGKSTLVKLILGLYEPRSGSVKIHGHNAFDSGEEYTNKLVGVVFQDFCMYPFTLRENVGFGNINHIDYDDAISKAINLGDASHILGKVKSLDTVLSRQYDDDGIELSGGEWQRIALARAYMSDKDIVIFDEPASKLDPISEVRQFQIIKESLSDKTAILISHRIGFARLADEIIVLKDGCIAESGTHEELIALQNEYYEMFMSQKKLYERDETQDDQE